MAIGNALVEMYNEMQAELDDKDDEEKPVKQKPIKQTHVSNAPSTEVCPECGEPIVHIGGCVQCPNCSLSRCE